MSATSRRTASPPNSATSSCAGSSVRLATITCAPSPAERPAVAAPPPPPPPLARGGPPREGVLRPRSPGAGAHPQGRRAGENLPRRGGDEEAGGEDQPEAAAARREAVDGRNDRRSEPHERRRRDLQPRRRLTQVVRKLLALRRERLDVAAGAEVRAVAAEDHDANARLAVAAHDRVVERAQEGHVQAIRRVGAVERQPRHAVAVEREQDGAVVDHARALKASMPSAAEASRRCSSTVARSSSSPSESERSSPASTSCLIRRRAAGALPASFAASSSTVVSSSPVGTARYASPQAAASDPVRRSPVSMCPSARWRPTMRGSRCEPPPPGTWPKLEWLSASRASSATIAMSHACISSKPPAIALPSTAATTGTGTSRTASHAARKLSNSSASAASPTPRRRSSSWKSPPTQKLPPAPRITMTRASSASRRTARSSSRPSATVIAFIASGRLRTMRPIPAGPVTRNSDVANRPDDPDERDAGPGLAAEVVGEPQLRVGD